LDLLKNFLIWTLIIMVVTAGIIIVWIAYLIERLIEKLKNAHIEDFKKWPIR